MVHQFESEKDINRGSAASHRKDCVDCVHDDNDVADAESAVRLFQLECAFACASCNN